MNTYQFMNDLKKLGRPKGTSIFTDEEKLLRRRQANMKHYYNSHDYYKLYNRLHKAEIREGKQIHINSYISVGLGFLISI